MSSSSAVLSDDRNLPADTALAAIIARLAAIPPGRWHVLTACIRLEQEDRWNARYLTELRRRIQELEQRGELAALDHAAKAAVQRDLERITARVEKPSQLPASRGLAIVACEELGLFTAVPLPRIHRPRLVLDDTPWLLEMVAGEAELLATMVVVLDRTHARFVRLRAGEAAPLASFELATHHGGKFHSQRGNAPGVGERDYQGRLEEERHRHYASIVQELDQLMRKNPVGSIILAGPQDHTSALERFLPPRLADLLVGTVALNPTSASTAEIEESAAAVLASHEQQAAVRLAASIESQVAEGWAVRGVAETLRALGRGQLRTLWVRDDVVLSGYRCSTTGRLTLEPNACEGEGEPLPVKDLLDEAVEEALRQRIDVVVVRDAAVAQATGGMAGLLRFRS